MISDLAQLPPHPRLVLTPAVEARARSLPASEPLLGGLLAQQRRDAEAALSEPVCRFEPDKRDTLLRQARGAQRRLLDLALAWRIEGDARLLERARAELLAAAALPAWLTGRDHFLDVGEMAAAVALGYDWLHEALPEAERATIRTALVEKALLPGLERAAREPLPDYFASATNINLVCNTGLTLAALAVAEDAPEVAARWLRFSLENVRRGVAVFAPDGVCPEGPMYWVFAMDYLCLLLDALEANGFAEQAAELARLGAIDRTLDYIAAATAPTGETYNWGDARSRPPWTPAMFWLARRFGRASVAARLRAQLAAELPRRAVEPKWTPELPPELAEPRRLRPLEIVWFEPGSRKPEAAPPLARVFRGLTPFAVFREAWDEPRALYVAVKAGHNRNPHAHLDLGSFVLERDGVRWALDLGPENYAVLDAYYHRRSAAERPRPHVFRNATRSHGTLMLDERDQVADAGATIVVFEAEARRGTGRVEIDLSAAYAESGAAQARRTLRVGADRVVRVEDALALAAPTRVRWAMATAAQVELRGCEARLRQGGEEFSVRVLEPAGAVFSLRDAQPETPEETPNPGVSMLCVEFAAEAGEHRIVVELGGRSG